MNDEGGKTILGRTKTKLLTTNKEELKDGITPLRSMQEVVGCCISTSLSIISFLSISFSFLLNFFSCLTLFPNSFLSFSSFSFLSCSSSSLNSCSNFSLSFCSLLWILILSFSLSHDQNQRKVVWMFFSCMLSTHSNFEWEIFFPFPL